MNKAQALNALAVADERFKAVYAEEYDAVQAFRASGSDAALKAMLEARAEKKAALEAWEAAQEVALEAGAFDPEPKPKAEQFAFAF